MSNVLEQPSELPVIQNNARHQALLGIAHVLGGYLEREARNNSEVDLPSDSLFTDMLHEAREFSAYQFDDETQKFSLNGWKSYYSAMDEAEFALSMNGVIIRAAKNTKWSDEIFAGTGLFSHDALLALKYYSLNHARKVLEKSDNPKDNLDALLIRVINAAENKPEDYDGNLLPKKHKHETEEQMLFRVAMRDINQLINKGTVFNKDEKKLQAMRKKLQDKTMDNGQSLKLYHDTLKSPENQNLRDAYLSLELKVLASRYKHKILDPAFSSETFREQHFALVKQGRARVKAEEPDIVVEETDWTILPPGTMEVLEASGTDNNPETQDFVDLERMKWLARIAINWGPDAYIAIANLRKSGDYDYRVAVLPQKTDEISIEHAVAENPASGNALYVFRGERGLEDDRQTSWLTWKEVLSDTKSGARALGARRILHSASMDENVLEYITRPEKDLDKPSYRR